MQDLWTLKLRGRSRNPWTPQHRGCGRAVLSVRWHDAVTRRRHCHSPWQFLLILALLLLAVASLSVAHVGQRQHNRERFVTCCPCSSPRCYTSGALLTCRPPGGQDSLYRSLRVQTISKYRDIWKGRFACFQSIETFGKAISHVFNVASIQASFRRQFAIRNNVV